MSRLVDFLAGAWRNRPTRVRYLEVALERERERADRADSRADALQAAHAERVDALLRELDTLRQTYVHDLAEEQHAYLDRISEIQTGERVHSARPPVPDIEPRVMFPTTESREKLFLDRRRVRMNQAAEMGISGERLDEMIRLGQARTGVIPLGWKSPTDEPARTGEDVPEPPSGDPSAAARAWKAAVSE
jgi:hypothetical protein